MIQILLVHEHSLMANIIGAVLSAEPDMAVVISPPNPMDVTKRAVGCDVALISTRLPQNQAISLAQSLGEEAPNLKVIMLGLAESQAEILQYFEAGAAGYVLKDDSVEHLLENIRAAHEGHALVSPTVAGALIDRLAELAQIFAEVAAVPDAVDLTPRERQVLELIAEGMTNHEIAEELVIEVGTVKNHVHNILRKLNVNSRQDAAAYLAIMQNSQ